MLLDLYKSVVECKRILYCYANLLENYKDKSCEEKKNIFFTEIQPEILKFDAAKDKATIFLKKHKKLQKSLDEFSKAVSQVGTAIRIHLVEPEELELHPHEIKYPNFEALLKTYSRVIQAFNSEIEIP